jgi:PAS domain S-box-containing protein
MTDALKLNLRCGEITFDKCRALRTKPLCKLTAKSHRPRGPGQFPETTNHQLGAAPSEVLTQALGTRGSAQRFLLMKREPATEDQTTLIARLSELEQENAALRSKLAQSDSDAQTAARKPPEQDRQHDYRRASEHGRAELASPEGMITALQSIQFSAREMEIRTRALLRSASDFAILETDSDGRIIFWNAGAEALLGWRSEEALEQNISMLFTPEDRDAGEPERERQEALANGRSDTERWHVRKDGSRFYAHERVVASIEDQRERFLKVLRNRSEEHATEEARFASEEQMRLILDSATDYAIFTLDREGVVTTWNTGAERLLGYTDDEIIGQNGLVVFTPEDREAGESNKEISKALNEGRAQNERWHMRKDGSRFWGSGLMLPLRGDGDPGLLKIMRDDTARHHADEMNKLLIGELNHRVKNTLSVVQAIARETVRGRVAEAEIRDALDSRLAALARSHDILARESWEGASLIEVINGTLLPFLVHDKPEDRLIIEGTDVRLLPNSALSLSMGFHELATNAAKYGALSAPEGSIDVRWSDERADGGGIRLKWRERNGPPVSPPSRKGFGSRLIERALAYEMNSTVSLDYAPDGLRFEISIPNTALQER